MLVVSSLSKQHPNATRPVFRDINFSVQAGQIVALVGESGVGKSTLLNCIAGLETSDMGSVQIGSQNMMALNEAERARHRARSIGFVFQAFHVLPTLTVAQNIAVPLLLKREPISTHVERINHLLNRVGLSGFGARMPSTLSGGELQRVAIARALVHQPPLILADEPTGNLDPRTANDVLSLLLERCREQNTAALIVTHSAHVAAACDHTLTLTLEGLQA
jgi:putative ABC transport system ATP-binding protein